MRGEQAIFNIEIKKKCGLSNNPPDIHHSKVFSSEWIKRLQKHFSKPRSWFSSKQLFEVFFPSLHNSSLRRNFQDILILSFYFPTWTWQFLHFMTQAFIKKYINISPAGNYLLDSFHNIDVNTQGINLWLSPSPLKHLDK